MTTLRLPLNEINHQAITILCREMGVVNTIRFIHQYSTGAGNYTEERETYFENKSLSEIISEIKTMRNTK